MAVKRLGSTARITGLGFSSWPTIISPYSIDRLCLRYASSSSSSSSSSATGGGRYPATSITQEVPRTSWKNAPVSQKIQRTTSFTASSLFVVFGLLVTGITGYYFVTTIVLPTGDVVIFNKAFDKIRKDPECISVIGSRMKGYGEDVRTSGWIHDRPIAAQRGIDKQGLEHVWLKFHVEGSQNKGVARLEMVKRPDESDFTYRYLILDVPGHQRITLVSNVGQNGKDSSKKGFLGVQWGKKKPESD